MSLMKYSILILLIFHHMIFRFVFNQEILEKYLKEPNRIYHGRYTRNVTDPHILVPRRVSSDGSFNTYFLSEFYDRQAINAKRKRSIGSIDEDKLHLVLPFNGIDHHLELTPYHDFIAPDMVIEVRGEGISSDLSKGLKFTRVSDHQCHYRGTIRGHENSRAALSLCDGVAGYVHTDHGRYFIEPLHNVDPEPDGQHVHIAYQQRAPHEDENPLQKNCGTDEDWESAWIEQLTKRHNEGSLRNYAEQKREDKEHSATHSIHRFIEGCIVADKKFLNFHKGIDIQQYLLTISNMVADFFHDKSAGNQIDFVIVRMIYLEKEEEEIDLTITPSAEKTLESFAKWAMQMNPESHTHPNHHDVGILVTRHDICAEDSGCSLMGLAYMSAICDRPKAACINEDGGLLLGVIVTHEVGHTLGCAHDSEEESGCPPQDEDGSYFFMSPFVFIYSFRWSSCCRKYMTTLMETGLGDCLTDDPKNPPDNFKYPNMLPGAMYGNDFQCKIIYNGSDPCDQAGDCEALWCQQGEKCITNNSPPAEGTHCEENKWCIHKECVEIGSRPKAINGAWGDWGPMTECSRTCGGGVKASERECDNPTPENGGRYCIGERKKYSVCNTTPCDPEKPSYRKVQCEEFNTKEVTTGGLHQWAPYTKNVDMCKLYCINEKKVFTALAPTVKDGTPCKPGTNHMCVAGVCRIVGCDWKLDSDAVEDKCGVCMGGGANCAVTDGDFTKTGLKGYQEVVKIPKESRNIHMFEKKASGNTLAVKLDKEDTYCLNGGFKEEADGEYRCANAIIIYTHPETDKEDLSIKGPITEDIQLQVLSDHGMWDDPGSERKLLIAGTNDTFKAYRHTLKIALTYTFYGPDNPGVHYEYSTRSLNSKYTPKYDWDFLEWSECSVKCGGGTKISEALCVEANGGKVSAKYCDKLTHPHPKSQTCNEQPCLTKWRVSQWSRCGACGGKTGFKYRKVQCVRSAAHPGEDDVQLELNECRGRVPKQKIECVGDRPCRKICKKTREVKESIEGTHPANFVEPNKLIDRFVDVGLAPYLESHSVSGKRAASDNLKQLLHSWIAGEKPETQRSNKTRVFTTPKPGSIIKDAAPRDQAYLIVVPIRENNLQMNLSDQAFQQAGDAVGISLDMKRKKIYRGKDAINMQNMIAHHNVTEEFFDVPEDIQEEEFERVE